MQNQKFHPLVDSMTLFAQKRTRHTLSSVSLFFKKKSKNSCLKCESQEQIVRFHCKVHIQQTAYCLAIPDSTATVLYLRYFPFRLGFCLFQC